MGGASTPDDRSSPGGPETEAWDPSDDETAATVTAEGTAFESTELPELPDRFRDVRQIGRGGMGLVLEAFDTRLERDVAIKVLPRDHWGSGRMRQRFLREARSAGALAHPHIAAVHDIDEGGRYIVMELVRGGTLADRLAREGPLDVAEVRRVGDELLDALGAAHRAGVVHRDVKPSNLLVDETGHVKLADFGIAAVENSSVTVTGTSVGTPAYMAPEQLRGQSTDARADIYAAGATLFEAGTGRRLHADDGSVRDARKELREVTGDRRLADAIATAVAADPAARHRDAETFARSLRDTGRARGWGMAGAAAGVVALTLGLGYAYLAEHDAAAVRADAGVDSRVGQVAIARLADRSGRPDLEFVSHGIPSLLADELGDDVPVIDAYMFWGATLHSMAEPTRAEWIVRARKIGARYLLTGELSARGEQLRVGLELTDLADDSVVRLGVDTTAAELPSAVQSLAPQIVRAITGRDPPERPRPSRSLEAERHLRVGIDALAAHDHETALRNLQAALVLDEDLASARYAVAVTVWWMGQSRDKVGAAIDAALERDLSDKQRAFLDGLALFNRLEFTRAIDHFENARRSHARDRDLLYGLFEAQYHGGRPARAMSTYRELRTLYPDFALGIVHPLEYYVSRGDHEGIGWVLVRIPDTPDGRHDVWHARVLIARRDYPGALKALEALIDEAKSEAALQYAELDLVATRLLAGDLRGAEQAVRDGSTLDDWRQPGLELALATVTGDPRRRRLALARLRKLIASHVDANSQRVTARLLASIVALDGTEQELADALSILERYTDASEPRVSQQAVRALVAGALGRTDVVDELANSPHPEVVAIVEGLRAAAASDWQTAAAAWRRAIDVSSDGHFHIAERLHLARALRATEDHEAVQEVCDEVVRPRMFDWQWTAAVSTCSVWSGDAAVAIGDHQRARQHYGRVIALRTAAADDDRDVTTARAALAALPAAPIR